MTELSLGSTVFVTIFTGLHTRKEEWQGCHFA